MKKIMLVVVLLAVPFLGMSQNLLKGTITDKATGEPLFGATIIIVETQLFGISDPLGNYFINYVNSGKIEIRVSYVGYKQQIKTIIFNGNITIDFPLEAAPYQMVCYDVIATRATEKSGMAFTNLSKEDIEKNNIGQDIPYILKLTPSLVETSDGGTGVGYTYLRIRGSDATRINATINGIPVNDAEDHGVYWVDMPDMIASVDNIQIQRGVGTSTNGGSAFGATINMQTTALDTAAHAESSSTYGSYKTWKNSLSFGTGLLNNHWDIEGRISKITSQGYIDRASSDLKSFFASCGYYGKNSVVKFIVSSGIEKTYQAWNGVPQDTLPVHRRYNLYTYPNETDNYQMDNFQLLYSAQLSSKWNINAGLHYTHGAGYYEQSLTDEPFNNYGLQDVIINTDTITTTNMVRQLWLDNQFYGTTFALNYDANKKLKFTVGGAANRYNGDHFTKIVWAQTASNSNNLDKYQDNTAVKKDGSVYVKVYYQLSKKFTVFGDVQYRSLSYTFLGYDENSNNTTQTVALNFFNPKAGINYDISNNKRLYASYSIGNREPNRDDYIQSTPLSRPKPEHLADLEVGYKQQTTLVSFGINGYYMNYKDQLVNIGQLNDVGAYINQNIPQSYREGIEIEAAFKLGKKMDLQANISFSSNKLIKHDEYVDNYDSIAQSVIHFEKTDIAFSPNIVSSEMLNYHPSKNLTISLINKYVSKQYLDNTANEKRSIRAYNINDLRFRYAIKLSCMKELDFGFTINNILNKNYESNGWTYSYIEGGETITQNNYFPQAPRNYLGTIVLKF